MNLPRNGELTKIYQVIGIAVVGLVAGGGAYNNTIESSRRGLRVANTGTNVIKNCHFKNTSGPAIKVEAGCTVTSDYNHFDSEYAGMLVDESGNSYATVAAWTAATSRDANSTIGTRAVGNGLRDGVWVAGVRAADDLPIPLHPDRGADQDRTAPGRRFGVGGGTL